MNSTRPNVPSGSAHREETRRQANDRAEFQTSWERLFVALGYLVHGSGTIQYRLDCAYVRCLLPLRAADIPANIRAELDEISAILAGTHERLEESEIRERIARLPDADAREAAGRILSLFNYAARSYPLQGRQ